MVYYQYPIFKESFDGSYRVKFTSEINVEVIKVNKSENYKVGDVFNTVPHFIEKFWFDCPSDVNKSYYYEVIEWQILQKELYTDSEIIKANEKFGKKFIKTGRRFVL